MRLNVRFVCFTVAVCAFAAVVLTISAPRPVASVDAEQSAVDAVLVKFSDLDRGDQLRPVDAERLAGLRAAAARVGVSIEYRRTMAIGAYVIGLDRPLFGAELDVLLSGLRRSDPAIEWVSPDDPLTPTTASVNDPMAVNQWYLDDGPAAMRVLQAWDEDWQWAAGELKPGYVGYPPRLVRYGKDGVGWSYKELAGDFTCSPQTFGGDPVPNQVKHCEVAKNWRTIASDKSPNFDLGAAPKVIRYGWGDAWVYKTVSGAATCSPATFLEDPWAYQVKVCQVEERTDGGGVVAASGRRGNPDEQFRLTTTQTVRYGVTTAYRNYWVYKQLAPGTYSCSPSTFKTPSVPSGDPVFGLYKHCQVVKSTGSGVRIGFIERGIIAHPDLDGQWVAGVNGFDGSTKVLDPGYAGCDMSKLRPWHMLLTSGVAVAVADNNIGIAGVAPHARASISIGNRCDTSTSLLLDVMMWLSGERYANWPDPPLPADRPRVIALSVDKPGPCGPEWDEAIGVTRGHGVMVVASAGNQGKDLQSAPTAPATCKDVVTVAGTTRTGSRWSGSNFSNSYVDLSAPGEQIVVLDDRGTVTPTESAVSLAEGTSMSSPFVAAVAAMMFGKNPSLSNVNVEKRLRLSARPFPTSCAGCGAGIVDATRALESAQARTTELEPNHAPDWANEITAPADITAKFDTTGGMDWYRVSIPPGSLLRLDFQAGNDGDCRLYDEEHTEYTSCRNQMPAYTNPYLRTTHMFIGIEPDTAGRGKPYTFEVTWTDTRI